MVACMKAHEKQEKHEYHSSLDGITCKDWALKDCMNIVAEPLQFLIIAFIGEGSFPQQLKQAHKTSIFKSGDAEDAKKY